MGKIDDKQGNNPNTMLGNRSPVMAIKRVMAQGCLWQGLAGCGWEAGAL